MALFIDERETNSHCCQVEWLYQKVCSEILNQKTVDRARRSQCQKQMSIFLLHHSAKYNFKPRKLRTYRLIFNHLTKKKKFSLSKDTIILSFLPIILERKWTFLFYCKQFVCFKNKKKKKYIYI